MYQISSRDSFTVLTASHNRAPGILLLTASLQIVLFVHAGKEGRKEK